MKISLCIVILLTACAVLLALRFRHDARGHTDVPADGRKNTQFAQTEQAALAGDTSAMNSLALMYHEGRGVIHDESQALRWFEQAAAAGSTSAMNNLGLISEHPDAPGVSPDYRRARSWFEKAAKAGDASGMFHLGVMYEEAEGMPRNEPAARQLFEKAAAAGNQDAQDHLRHLARSSQ